LDSSDSEPKIAHVPLPTALETKPQVPEPTPNQDKTVNLPFQQNDAAALKDQTPALSNLTLNKDSTSPMKNPDKSNGPKKSKKNQGKSAQFQCTDCSKVFTTFGALRIHKTIHTGELPHKCSYCDKRFRTPGQVRVHHRRHTGEKPFKCKVRIMSVLLVA